MRGKPKGKIRSEGRKGERKIATKNEARASRSTAQQADPRRRTLAPARARAHAAILLEDIYKSCRSRLDSYGYVSSSTRRWVYTHHVGVNTCCDDARTERTVASEIDLSGIPGFLAMHTTSMPCIPCPLRTWPPHLGIPP